ncbi:MAG: lytic transglycosylase domain-containing protein [Myxococcota bacterium]
MGLLLSWLGAAARIALVLLLAALSMLQMMFLLATEAVAPGLEPWTRPARKAIGERQHRYLRGFVRQPFLTIIVGVLLGISAINTGVRWTGGRPHLLSVHHLSDKAVALVRLGLHLPFHPISSCGQDQDTLIREAAAEFRVPLALMRAVVRTESGFRPHVISHAGAMGVMQLMPATAREMGVWDPFDAKESLRGGARYLAFLYGRYDGDLRRTAAAYHAGPHAVPVKGRPRIGATTRRYVKVILRRVREERGRMRGGSGEGPP